MDESKILAESSSAEAANAMAVAEEARQKAHFAQLYAVQEESDKRAAKIQWETLERFFNRGIDEKKFVDIGRIPFICDDIKSMHISLKNIEDNAITKTDFALLKQKSDLTNKIVSGFVGLILVAFVGSLIKLTFIH